MIFIIDTSNIIYETVRLRDMVLKEKQKLVYNVKQYKMYLFNLNINMSKEKKEDIDKLYGTILGTLFKNFYGYSSSNLKRILKSDYEEKIKDNEIIHIMDIVDLKFYLSMLISTNNLLESYTSLSINNLLVKIKEIAKVAKEKFCETYKMDPITYFLNKFNKKRRVVERNSKMEERRKKLISEVKREKNELAFLLSEISGVDNPRRLANILFGWYILYGLYGKKLDKIREDLAVDKNFDILPLFGIMHLEACISALKRINEIVSYKNKNASRVINSIKENAFASGILAKEVLKRNLEIMNGRKTSVYNDLLKSMRNNLLEKDRSELEEKIPIQRSFFDDIVLEEASNYRDSNMSLEEQREFYRNHPEAILEGFDEVEPRHR